MKKFSNLASYLLALLFLTMGLPAILFGLAIAWVWYLTSPDTGE